MTSINIKLFATFRELMGRKEMRLELGNEEKHTVLGAIEKLIEKKGSVIGTRLFDEKGDLRKGVQIFLNGRKVRTSNKAEISIKNNDEIAILPTVGGGGAISGFLPCMPLHDDIPDVYNIL